VRAVLVDTNMFAVPFVYGIDMLYQIGMLVPDAKFTTTSRVVDETSKLKNHVLIIKIIKRNFEVISAKGKTDDTILREAKKRKGIVATNDKELKQRCLKEDIPVIFMRGKSRLDIKYP
jgi:rRNA-processing protein FCF1